MKDPVASLQPTRRSASVSADKTYRRARKTAPATEDEALNALCDASSFEKDLAALRAEIREKAVAATLLTLIVSEPSSPFSFFSVSSVPLW